MPGYTERKTWIVRARKRPRSIMNNKRTKEQKEAVEQLITERRQLDSLFPTKQGKSGLSSPSLSDNPEVAVLLFLC